MATAELSSHSLLQSLSSNPKDENLLEEITARLADPFDNIGLVKALHATVGAAPPVWTNCIGEQECFPKAILYPKCIQDLVDAVDKATTQHLHLRAVGSGHSFSNVAPCFKGDLLLNPERMNKAIPIDSSILRDPSIASKLFSVESGITIKNLNKVLDSQQKALINMGAYDGQTLAGAISTGTHGTGISLGPMANSVRSLVLVSETKAIYQIEPSNGITDPVNFAKSKPDVILRQDDEWFQSCVVAMGCMGLIYSYTLEVVPTFFLEETRSLHTWEALKASIPQLLSNNRHFEIDINPYALAGAHSCIKVIRNTNNGPKRGWRGIKNWIAGLIAVFPAIEGVVVHVLNKYPAMSPFVIDKALGALRDANYVAKSYKVMNLGPVDKLEALAVELSFDATNATTDASALIKQVDHLLDIFAQFAAQNKWYLAGPIALRFVAASNAYLAPQTGRPTCVAELDLLVGITNGVTLLKEVKEAICVKGSGIRVHWGLDLDTVTKDEVPDMFPQYEKWLSVYRQLNSSGIFNSPFTDRLGISVV